MSIDPSRLDLENLTVSELLSAHGRPLAIGSKAEGSRSTTQANNWSRSGLLTSALSYALSLAILSPLRSRDGCWRHDQVVGTGRHGEGAGGVGGTPAGNFVRSPRYLPSMTLRADVWQPGPLPNTHPNPRGLPIIVEFYVPRALRRDAAMRQPFVFHLWGRPKFVFHARSLSLPWTHGAEDAA